MQKRACHSWRVIFIFVQQQAFEESAADDVGSLTTVYRRPRVPRYTAQQPACDRSEARCLRTVLSCCFLERANSGGCSLHHAMNDTKIESLQHC